jgi:hypothetical protein
MTYITQVRVRSRAAAPVIKFLLIRTYLFYKFILDIRTYVFVHIYLFIHTYIMQVRVRSHAAAAVINFCEHAQPAMIVPHLDSLMNQLRGLLQVCVYLCVCVCVYHCVTFE